MLLFSSDLMRSAFALLLTELIQFYLRSSALNINFCTIVTFAAFLAFQPDIFSLL